MAFEVNQVIGNYECLGVIDKPRSGITYKVRNLVTGEVESLRALLGASARDSESGERLAREIRLHARLTHRNVVAFHDAFELDGQVVMTTDYVEGPTLAELCSAGPLPVGDAASIIIQVLDALEEAHSLGIVHRGITAEHVNVSADGLVKLGGFDLAKPANSADLTKVGAVIGDPRYVSPEQVIGKSAADQRTDLYSVGVLLYLCVTGKIPFDGESEFDILSAHINASPQPPRQMNPAVSAELERLILRALAKRAEERFPTAGEFRAALVALNDPLPLRSSSGEVSTQAVRETQPQQDLPRAQRANNVTALVAGAIALLAVVAWIALR